MEPAISMPKASAKPRKRIDAIHPSNMKRSSDGSAFARCDSCKKDIPAAIFDMHDCVLDVKTQALVAKAEMSAVNMPLKEKNGISGSRSNKTEKRKAEPLKAKKEKKAAKIKDPDMPKRPPTAFFIFMEEFRKSYKAANPAAKGGAMVAKEGGDKWKSMSDEMKSSFIRKASELKEKYEIAMKAYKSNIGGGATSEIIEERYDENDCSVEDKGCVLG